MESFIQSSYVLDMVEGPILPREDPLLKEYTVEFTGSEGFL